MVFTCRAAEPIAVLLDAVLFFNELLPTATLDSPVVFVSSAFLPTAVLLSAVVLLSDNYIYLRDTTGANDIGLTGHTVELGEHVYTITREGNSLKYYVDSCLKATIDVTGRTFELDTFGRPTDSLADLTADWGVWNKALTKEELDYFSYLRSEDTNEILLPPLTPTCP